MCVWLNVISIGLRDEVVNEQYLIEEIYDRELTLAEQFDETISFSHSGENYSSCSTKYNSDSLIQQKST